MKNKNRYIIFVHLFFIIFSLLIFLPFLTIVLLSFSRESDIAAYGYSIIPRHISFTAYEFLFTDASQLFRSIFLTLIVSFLGAAFAIVVNASIGYTVSRPEFALRNVLMKYIIFTMIFSGGLIPSYLVNTKLLHLSNNPLVYILPGSVTAWTIILFRTFFSQIPKPVLESATIDGATQMQTLIHIVIPMSKPIIATLFFTGLLSRWNNWETALYYITDSKYYTIQYFMQKILKEASFLKQAYTASGVYSAAVDFPVETMRFAMCVISVIPIFISFPYLQKYFSKGLSVGSVKG